jgi:hypothetical protein
MTCDDTYARDENLPPLAGDKGGQRSIYIRRTLYHKEQTY